MTATIHDSGYKRLFSNKTIFRQLMQDRQHYRHPLSGRGEL